jgi:hypothetical protein
MRAKPGITKGREESLSQNLTVAEIVTKFTDPFRNPRPATGWMVRGSNPDGGEIFRTCPDRPWGPPRLLYNRYRVFPGGKERPGRDADPSHPSSVVGYERVELYLYSPYGPYGLYRSSVSVQGCTLLFRNSLTPVYL